MFNFYRIFYLALYVVCFLAAFASFYTSAVLYSTGGKVINLNVVMWGLGGVVLTVLAILLYRVYRKLAGR